MTQYQLLSARMFLGWTQQYFCQQLGISLPTYAKWEKDGSCIPQKKLDIIKDVLNKHGIEFVEEKATPAKSSGLRESMQGITSNQLLGARMFLGWTQPHLTNQIDVSVTTLAKWEKGENSIPEKKIRIIKEVFSNQGIEFIEDKGFLKGSYISKNYSGAEGLRVVFDNMYDELSKNKNLEVYAIGAEDSHFIERIDFAEIHTHRMQRLMPKMRVIKGPSTLKNLQSYAEYRIADTTCFDATPIYIYGHKVILMSWDPLEAVVIEHPAHYHSFKALFEHLWVNCKNPWDLPETAKVSNDQG